MTGSRISPKPPNPPTIPPTMTEAEINAAIAEACGWTWWRLPSVPSDGDRRYRCLFLKSILCGEQGPPNGFAPADMTERVCNWEYMKREGLVSDYCHDLNAMQSAVLAQPAEFQRRFSTGQSYRCSGSSTLFCQLTAHDWAEIFLQVLRS